MWAFDLEAIGKKAITKIGNSKINMGERVWSSKYVGWPIFFF